MIRAFRNGDLPALTELWCAHWSRLGPPPAANVPIIEQAVLSRPFFDASQLLVIESEQAVTGWCHFNQDDAGEATILAICLSDDGLDSATELMQEVESRVKAAGCDHIIAGVVRDDRYGYAGLSPVGHGIGIADTDQTLVSLLAENGFAPHRQAQRCVASTTGYRPPVNRDALQLRRSTQLRSAQWYPDNNQLAAALSHLDVERFALVDQKSGSTIAELDVWLSDPEAEVMPGSHAILDLGGIHDSGQLEPAQAFLIGSLVQTLAARHIRTIETVIDTNQTSLIESLSKLHFQPTDAGTCWSKQLAAP